VDDVARAAGLAGAADQHRDVGALAAAVRVQLVEHQEAQARGLLEQRRVVWPRQDQLQHHVVGEQDVWRARDDLRALGPGSPGRCSGGPSRAAEPARNFFSSPSWLLASAFIG
jgi:hypothetical protein